MLNGMIHGGRLHLFWRILIVVGRSPEGWKTPEQGAATSVLLATSPLLAGIGGRYQVRQQCSGLQAGGEADSPA